MWGGSRRYCSRRGDGAVTLLTGWQEQRSQYTAGSHCARHAPVSQICAFTVLPSTLMDRVANSTPMVDFDSRLNSFLVNRERTNAKRVSYI